MNSFTEPISAELVITTDSGKQGVQMYKTTADGTLRQFFEGFDRPLEDLCLTNHQITAFCRDYYNELRKENLPTFFLEESCQGLRVRCIHKPRHCSENDKIVPAPKGMLGTDSVYSIDDSWFWPGRRWEYYLVVPS
jgi:hypothetical protein